MREIFERVHFSHKVFEYLSGHIIPRAVFSAGSLCPAPCAYHTLPKMPATLSKIII